nr:MAG TPA: hypothetical protein [Caudoviricetes sp.]
MTVCIIAQSVSTSYERSKSMYLSEIGLEKAEKGLQHIFDIEDEKVRKNIKDRRTNAADKRKIKIELVYEPSSDRDFVTISYSIKSDLAQIQGGAIQVELLENGEERPAITENRINGQVDYRDLAVDEDGVVQEGV